VSAPERASAIIARARLHAPGVQLTTDFALASSKQPALAFGYGVIDSGDIAAALLRLRRALED